MFHTIVIVGNLGQDPDMRMTPGGQYVTSLNVATNRQYTGSDGQPVKETTWFRVSVWGRQAEACAQYLQKGRQVLVEGHLRPDPNTGSPKIWTRQDGTAGASYEVTARVVRFLGGRADAEGTYPPGEYPASQQAAESDEDIPF